eukprot:7879959-Pyramimonas_sp.AAC.1
MASPLIIRCTTHLGWSLHPCITQHPLFTFAIQGWGPRATRLIIRCTTHLEDASGILRFKSGSEAHEAHYT